MEYQSEHWGQNFGFFFGTAAYQLENAIKYLSEGRATVWGLWIPNLLWSFFALAIMIPAARRLRPGYTAWFIAYYAVAIGATWLLSAPRYLVAMPVIPPRAGADRGQPQKGADGPCHIHPARRCISSGFHHRPAGLVGRRIIKAADPNESAAFLRSQERSAM